MKNHRKSPNITEKLERQKKIAFGALRSRTFIITLACQQTICIWPTVKPKLPFNGSLLIYLSVYLCISQRFANFEGSLNPKNTPRLQTNLSFIIFQ